MGLPTLGVKALTHYLKPLTVGLSNITNPLIEGASGKWIYPIFGTAAAAPIIGYELDKIRKAREAKEEAAKKLLENKQDKRAANEKQARLDDLNLLRDVLRRVKADKDPG